MARKRVAITLSLPPDLAKKYERLAKSKGENKSQLFREIIRFYISRGEEEEYYQLQRYGYKKARELKITEEDIERLVFEGR